MDKKLFEDMLKHPEADRSPGYVEETLETAGCTGQCPTYPGAPVTEDGYPVCSKCSQRNGLELTDYFNQKG